MTDERARAERFADLFRAVYLTFHRRDGPRSQLPGASRAVLEHLALAGPLTVGEAAAHMSRAQSVISEIVTHLERQELLEREEDPADRRRTLIWLTTQGHEALRRDREVLSVDMLAGAMARLPPDQGTTLASRATARGPTYDGRAQRAHPGPREGLSPPQHRIVCFTQSRLLGAPDADHEALARR